MTPTETIVSDIRKMGMLTQGFTYRDGIGFGKAYFYDDLLLAEKAGVIHYNPGTEEYDGEDEGWHLGRLPASFTPPADNPYMNDAERERGTYSSPEDWKA